MSITYAPAARADLAAAIDYLAQRNTQAAEQLQGSIEALLASLDDGDFDGPEQTLKTGERVHSWPLAPWWRVYYQRPEDGVLYVMRIYHQAQRPIVRRPRRRKK